MFSIIVKKMPAQIISTKSAEHYTWGAGCDGWHLVKTAQLSVIEERMPARQFFLCARRRADHGSGTSRLRGSSGQGIEVSPGQQHQAQNKSRAALRIIVVSQPPSHGDRVEA
jgi:hypothetical protein